MGATSSAFAASDAHPAPVEERCSSLAACSPPSHTAPSLVRMVCFETSPGAAGWHGRVAYSVFPWASGGRRLTSGLTS